MKRRDFLGVATGGALMRTLSAQADPWGATQGYPSGWGHPRAFLSRTQTRVGNYSGGFEQMFPARTIRRGASFSPLSEASAPMELRFRRGLTSKTLEEYVRTRPVTALLIARKGQILAEYYAMGRTPAMRMTGWSMSKSITALLLGLAIDQGRITSVDDSVEKYVSGLAGTIYSDMSLRNLMNMSIGIQLTGDLLTDNQTFYSDALFKPDSNILSVLQVNRGKGAPGTKFLYNDLAPLVLGEVIRNAVGNSLSEFCEQALWHPMGAEADATWLTDSLGREFNCIGFAARVRDWARLGQLVAQRGRLNEQQIISRGWIDECLSWGEKDHQVRVGQVSSAHGLATGYKAFFWHAKADGSRPQMSGFHGQRIMIDMESQTVLVQTAVDHEGWMAELNPLFEAAVAHPGR
jgi:CubicO group peptidase (beta-lactamase class C family)